MNKIEKIIEEIDKSTLLGAAWDCLSEAAKTKFKAKIQKILDDDNCSSEPSPV